MVLYIGSKFSLNMLPFEKYDTVIYEVMIREISLEVARELIREYMSVGVPIEGVASKRVVDFLSLIFGIEIPVSREAIKLKPEDSMIVAQLNFLPQRKDYTEEEIEELFKEGRIKLIHLSLLREYTP